MLASNAGIQRFYRGMIRNVEQTDDPALPEAQGRIADVDAKDARQLPRPPEKGRQLLPAPPERGHHRSGQARFHRSPALPLARNCAGQWALNDVFAGIHAAGLLAQDFDVLAQQHASIVWSPLSNLLLYGGTARVDAARAAGVRIGLGSDWSPTGSKNLLGELKVAWLYSQQELKDLFTARDLVAMATRDAARILKWDGLLGTIAPGARADLLAIQSTVADPYEALLRAKETDIVLVTINGVARYGTPALMTPLAQGGETVSIGGESRRLFLKQESADPDVGGRVSQRRHASSCATLSSISRSWRRRRRSLSRRRRSSPWMRRRIRPGLWRSPRSRTGEKTCAPASPEWTTRLYRRPSRAVESRRRAAFDDLEADSTRCFDGRR